MKNNKSHTVLPWEFDGDWTIWGEETHRVAWVTNSNSNYNESEEEAKANAQFIVTSVNNHHKLVEACEAALRHFGSPYIFSKKRTIEQLEQALDGTKGEE